MKQLEIIRQIKTDVINELQIVRQKKIEFENDLKEQYFIKDVGNEYLIQCKDCNVYIKKDWSRFSFCIDEAPISEIYPENEFEKFNIIETIKKYI
jgi:hypothetical protein